MRDAQLVPVPGDTRRRYYVKDKRGRLVKGADGLPLTASRRQQEKAVAAAERGAPVRSLESLAKERRQERGSAMVRRALRALGTGEPDQTLQLARRRQAYDASRGITRSVDEVLADPEFQRDIAALNAPNRKRGHAPNSAKAKALVRFGMRRETDEFRVGESPKHHAQTVLAELAS